MVERKIFASESVTEGHPDKICDQIADALLDAILKQDPEARVAIEALVSNGLVVVAGEVTTEAYVDIQTLVREKIVEIGFDTSVKGFDGDTCGVLVSIGAQSPEIAKGVDTSLETRLGEEQSSFSLGAGDQGLMFGYATNENHDYMPTPINLAHLIAKKLATLRKTDEEFGWLYPDGKTQVIIGYENNVPVSVEHVLVSTQHSAKVDLEFVQQETIEWVIKRTLVEYNHELVNNGHQPLNIENTVMLSNPSGSWNAGGPRFDCGLVGRKIIVDTYGGFARHGGGNFHGKDPSKVDRSAAYALRWVAKNIIAAGLADRVELQVCYAIGKAEPLGLYVDTFGTARDGLTDAAILEAVKKVFDLRPTAIIDALGLKYVTNYQEVAKYGHFGANAIALDMPWERLNRVEELKQAVDSLL